MRLTWHTQIHTHHMINSGLLQFRVFVKWNCRLHSSGFTTLHHTNTTSYLLNYIYNCIIMHEILWIICKHIISPTKCDNILYACAYGYCTPVHLLYIISQLSHNTMKPTLTRSTWYAEMRPSSNVWFHRLLPISLRSRHGIQIKTKLSFLAPIMVWQSYIFCFVFVYL